MALGFNIIFIFGKLAFHFYLDFTRKDNANLKYLFSGVLSP
jgi:hypothetical protein